jgi:hypothetical protein
VVPESQATPRTPALPGATPITVEPAVLPAMVVLGVRAVMPAADTAPVVLVAPVGPAGAVVWAGVVVTVETRPIRTSGVAMPVKAAMVGWAAMVERAVVAACPQAESPWLVGQRAPGVPVEWVVIRARAVQVRPALPLIVTDPKVAEAVMVALVELAGQVRARALPVVTTSTPATAVGAVTATKTTQVADHRTAATAATAEVRAITVLVVAVVTEVTPTPR